MGTELVYPYLSFLLELSEEKNKHHFSHNEETSQSDVRVFGIHIGSSCLSSYADGYQSD